MTNTKLPPSLQSAPPELQDQLIVALPANYTMFDLIDIGFPLMTAYQGSNQSLGGSVHNANLTPDQQRQIDLATEQFKQSVNRVDNQLLQQYVQAVQNGNYAEAEAILENAQESQQAKTLMFALLTIGTILLPLYARQRLQNLLTRFGLHTVFAQTDSAQKAIRQQAEKGAKSHVRTIAKDLKKSLDDAIDTELTTPNIEAAVKDKYEDLANLDQLDYVKAVHKDQHIYDYARDLILSGATRDAVIKNLQENFAGVGKRRANVIAGNESNRVFNTSQYEADAQFLAQNQLTDKAYKRLVSNTGYPEAICKAIIEATHAKPIPFKQDFIPFNKEFSVKGDDGKTHKMTPKFERLKSGTIHVNCHCRYELLIKRDDGTFFNAANGKVENEADFTPDLHPRDKKGKFAKKGTGLDVVGGELDISSINDEESFNNFVENSKHLYEKNQANAAKLYQSPHFYKINDGFRFDQQTVSINGEKLSLDKFANSLDSTFDIKTKTEGVLHRGVADSPTDFIRGSTRDNQGYTSTSFVANTARSKFTPPGGSLIHITIPKGTSISVPDLVARDITDSSLDEQEAILKRGSSIRIDKIVGSNVYATLL